MFFYIVLTPISTTSGLWSTGNTRKYHQIDVYIYQCEIVYTLGRFVSHIRKRDVDLGSNLFQVQLEIQIV